MPASAQNIPSREELVEETAIDLRLCQCSGCGLVQLDCEPVPYFRDVIRAGGGTSTMVNLRRAQYRHFIDQYNLSGKKIIEIGAGRGEFLRILKEFDIQPFGIEHKIDLVESAQKDGLQVEQGFAETPDTILPNGPFDAFLSFNFLEHQPRPNDMLRCIYNNLRPGGYGLVTVPSLEYILQYDGFYELIHDHLAYYSENTLRFLMQKNGFEVLESTLVNRDTIAIIVQKRLQMDIRELRENLSDLTTSLNTFANNITRAGKKLALWGASHQGFTIIPATRITKSVSYIIDSAPFKQGLYAPASHVPIVSPEYFFQEPVDTILIVAPGYTEEIVDIIRKKYGLQVQIAVLRSRTLEILQGECKNEND